MLQILKIGTSINYQGVKLGNNILSISKILGLLSSLELAQFPVTEGWGRGSAKRTSERASARSITSAFIRLAQGVVDAIWLDLGALNQG